MRAAVSKSYYGAYHGLRQAIEPSLGKTVNYGAHEKVIAVVRHLVPRRLKAPAADFVEKFASDLESARRSRVDADYHLDDAECSSPMTRSRLLTHLVIVRRAMKDLPTAATAILNAKLPLVRWEAATK